MVNFFVTFAQYAPSKPKAERGVSSAQLREQTVEKLNDALLKWLDEVPPHRE